MRTKTKFARKHSIASLVSEILVAVSMFGGLFVLYGCGGGSSAPPPPPISVSLTNSPATVQAGATAQVTATVANDSSNKGVTWTLTQGGTSCSPGCGTVSPGSTASGAPTTYTAPAAVPANSAVTITATSVADTSKSAAAKITIAPPNPVPLVNQPLVPDAIAPGGAAFTISVNGTGFVSGSVVNWDGTALPTTFVSSSKLTANVPASDIANVGSASVTVLSPKQGGGASNEVFFPIATSVGFPVFTSSSFATGTGPSWVVVGDFNGDGKLDLAVPNFTGFGSGNTISILLGNGDGTFQNHVDYTVGTTPITIAAADLNGDGKLDLVVTNNLSASVSILLGNGDGTFQTAVNYATDMHPDGVAIADLNGDGKLDLVTANSASNDVSVLLGNGDGTFQAATNYASGGSAVRVAVGDFNGDGKLDLAVVNQYAGGPLSVLLGNGDGTFQAPVNYAVGSSPHDVAVADLNGDGKLDLITANNLSSDVSVLLGNGDGTFQAAVSYGAGSGPNSVAVADLNGDGKLDLIVANTFTNTVSVLLGNGDGTFQTQVPVSVGPQGSQSNAVAVGDFNQNGRLDLAVANITGNSVSVLLQ